MHHSWARKTILILSESIKVVYTAVKHPCYHFSQDIVCGLATVLARVAMCNWIKIEL